MGWVVKFAIPKLQTYVSETNYLYWLTPLIGFRLLEPDLDSNIFQDYILPSLQTLASDKVPNIKMNVIKVII